MVDLRRRRSPNAGFATSEPYIFKNELPRAGSRYDAHLQLINDTGYPMYGEALSIRAEDKDKLAPCLKKLVPIMQQCLRSTSSPTRRDQRA